METLDAFTRQLAQHIAHTRGWTLEQATRWVAQHRDEARREYRANGAPLGDTDAGFVLWLQPRQ